MAVVLVQVARSGQSSRAALRPTVRAADGAAPLGNRRGKNSELCSPSGCLDGDAPPLTPMLGIFMMRNVGESYGEQIKSGRALYANENKA